MFSLTCFALLAVASAAPQLRTQVLSTSQLPVNYQTIPAQTVQTLSSPYQTLQSPYQVQTVQTLQSPVETVATLQNPVQTIQTLPATYPTVRTVAQPQIIQTVPYNTLSGLQYQPIQPTIRVVQPASQLRTQTQTVRTVVQQQPIVQTTAAPVTVKSVTVTPQVRIQQVQVPQQVRLQQVQVPQQVRLQQVQVPQQVRIQQVQVPQQLRIQQVVPQQVRIQQVVPQVTVAQEQLAPVPSLRTVSAEAPQGVAILRQVQDVQPDGYAYAFETENGIKAQEEGRLINQGTDAESTVVQGSYSYVAPDGTPITVNYVADENGFRAEGEHIPKPSAEIARSLEYLRLLPSGPEDESGKYVRDSSGF